MIPEARRQVIQEEERVRLATRAEINSQIKSARRYVHWGWFTALVGAVLAVFFHTIPFVGLIGIITCFYGFKWIAEGREREKLVHAGQP